MEKNQKLMMLANRSSAIKESLNQLINDGKAYSAEAGNILDDYYKILFNARKLDKDIESPNVNKHNPIYLVGALEALTSAIRLSTGESAVEIEKIINENTNIKKQNQELINSLSKLINTEELKVDEKFLSLLPTKLRDRITEAYISYNHGAYLATCLLCGTVMEGLIIESTKDTNTRTLNDRITYLITNKKINTKESGKLLSVMKEYRDYSAHPTSKQFEKPNAGLFLNALIILTKDLNSKNNYL
jgi:hypothetical protein